MLKTKEKMPKAGLEPARLAPQTPQACVSTNYTTSAKLKSYNKRIQSRILMGMLERVEEKLFPTPPLLEEKEQEEPFALAESYYLKSELPLYHDAKLNNSKLNWWQRK